MGTINRVARMIVPIAVLAAIASPITTATTEQRQGGLQVGGVVAEPSVVLTGKPIELRGLVQNFTRRPVSVVVGTAVSTDLAPGVKWSEDRGRYVGSPVVLPAGAVIEARSRLTFVGDGWVRVGLIASGDEGIIPPTVRRVLVIDPLPSAIELITLTWALIALAVGVILVGRVHGSRARRGTPWDRRRSAGMLLAGAGTATWFAAAGLMLALPADILRGLTYAGVFFFVIGWILAFGNGSPRRATQFAVGMSSYLLLGTAWTLTFHVWEGFRPTSVLSSPEAWQHALMWPLMVCQVLLGLRFA